MQHDRWVGDGPVLWIVNDAANGAEDIGEGHTTRQEQAGKCEQTGSGHISLTSSAGVLQQLGTVSRSAALIGCGGPSLGNTAVRLRTANGNGTEEDSSSPASLAGAKPPL